MNSFDWQERQDREWRYEQEQMREARFAEATIEEEDEPSTEDE